MSYVNDYLYEGEAVLLPRKGTLTNIMYTKGKIWTVDTMYYATTNKNVVPYYLYSYLSILNLGDVFGNTFIVVAEVNGNQLSFHKNVLGAIFSGEGILNDNTLTLDYSINNFGDMESCVATCIKQ